MSDKSKKKLKKLLKEYLEEYIEDEIVYSKDEENKFILKKVEEGRYSVFFLCDTVDKLHEIKLIFNYDYEKDEVEQEFEINAQTMEEEIQAKKKFATIKECIVALMTPLVKEKETFINDVNTPFNN
jgi:hypothetical protein